MRLLEKAAVLSTFTVFCVLVYNCEFQDNLTPNDHSDTALNMNPTSYMPDKQSRDQKNTSKINHIGFLKVHKAGSTTIQNILFRYAVRNNLNLVLPKSKNNYIFSSDNVLSLNKRQHKQHYDIFAIHVGTYYKPLFKRFLPKDSVYLAIVRYPPDRMVSAAYYYRNIYNITYLSNIPASHFIDLLVNEPDKYDTQPFSHTRNTMGKDFGFSARLKLYDSGRIEEHLRTLESDFNLVMVVERFNESLVLMKRILSWDLEDILYIPSNSYKHEDRTLNKTQIARLKETCFLDFAIYDRFSILFQQKIDNEGPGFEDEVKNFEMTLEIISKFCTSQDDTKHILVKASKWNNEFNFLRSECNLMGMQEMFFIDRMKRGDY